MSKKQAEAIARKYVESNQKHFGNASQEAIDNAVKRVASALAGLPLQK